MNTLKTYLRINSAFSLISGVALAHYSDELFDFFGVMNNNYSLDIIGLSLFVFALFVWYVSAKQLHNSMLVKLISFLDILWVFGSIVIVAFQLFNLSTKGYYLISIVAFWVGFLAYKQIVNNK